jgi:SPP1 gp7 family putative phage head morphogenesis protein
MSNKYFDAMLRIALLVEGVKLDRSNDFKKQAVGFRQTLNQILRNIKYENLGDLTKTELNTLLAHTLLKCNSFFGAWQESFNDWYGDFIIDSYELNCSVLVALQQNYDQPATDDQIKKIFQLNQSNGGTPPLFGWANSMPGNDSGLRSKVFNTPSGANGIVPILFVNGFTTSAKSAILNRLRQGWANKEKVADVAADIVGNVPDSSAPSPQNAGQSTSIVDRIETQNRAVTDTVIQQAAQQTSANAQSALFDRYQWISIIDSHTTEICRSLNLMIFAYGEGPLPPAHIGCRSHTVPYGD